MFVFLFYLFISNLENLIATDVNGYTYQSNTQVSYTEEFTHVNLFLFTFFFKSKYSTDNEVRFIE